MSNGVRILISVVLGLLVSSAFWVASDFSSSSASATVFTNIPAVVAGFVFSSNPHQPSSVAVFVTMVVQWTLLSYVALWLFAIVIRKGRGVGGNDV